MRKLELDDRTHNKIAGLCERADQAAEQGKLDQALGHYAKALALPPEPASNWEAATWIYAAIGDVHFLVGSFEVARQAFQEAICCPGAIENPFLHLRLGQLALEDGDEDQAALELRRAFKAEGEEIFARDDPKYLAFLKARVDPPTKE